MSEVGDPECPQCLRVRTCGKAYSLILFILFAFLGTVAAIMICSVGTRPIYGISCGVVVFLLGTLTFGYERLWFGTRDYSFTICEQGELKEHLHHQHPADGSRDHSPIPWFPFTRSELPRYVRGPIIRVLVEGYLRQGRSQILGASIISDWSHASRLLPNGEIILFDKKGKQSHPMSLKEARQFLQRYPDYDTYLKEREHFVHHFPDAHVGLRALSIFLHQMHQRHNSRVALRAHDLVQLLLAEMNLGEDRIFPAYWQLVDPSLKLAELLAALESEQGGSSGVVTEPEGQAKEPAKA